MNAPPRRDSWWRPGLALLAFLLWAHPSLVGLPFAALLLLVPGENRPGWLQPLAGLIGAMSASLLVLTAQSGGRLAAVTSAYIVIVTAAFVGLIMMKPEPLPILRQTLRALLIGVLATGALIQVFWGSEAWGALAWEATREASVTMRSIVEVAPDTFMIYEPMVRFVSLTWPGMLALQTLAGLALAWHLYRRIAGAGVAATSFKDFRMGDGWVWGIVAWLGVLILPVSNTLHVAGTNLGLVASVLYALRGAAIVATFAEAFGVSVVALVIMAGVAAALAVPLLFVLPGLCTLGITDTWYQYRRRLAAARGAGPIQPKD
ncbi:MAG TPA: hypothetical protein VMR92_08640 [Gemmatimonadales bacterium]|nr:hypothetical protein [Gemmatimonadales bacterium]